MFAYCNNNPLIFDDRSGLLPNNRGILNPNHILYGDADSRFTMVHFPSPDWGEMWHYSNAVLDSGSENLGMPVRLKVGTIDASILSATNDGFNVVAADVSYLTMIPYYHQYNLPVVNYITASVGLGTKNSQIYADALAAILSASHDFRAGPFNISLSGYAGGMGVRASIGLTGFSFHAAYNVGFGISVSWQS